MEGISDKESIMKMFFEMQMKLIKKLPTYPEFENILNQILEAQVTYEHKYIVANTAAILKGAELQHLVKDVIGTA